MAAANGDLLLIDDFNKSKIATIGNITPQQLILFLVALTFMMLINLYHCIDFCTKLIQLVKSLWCQIYYMPFEHIVLLS